MLSEREKQEVKRVAKKHRSRAKIVNAESIPARDTDDAYGNPFLGIPSNRFKYRDIGPNEQADNSTDNRVLAPDAVLNGNIGEQIQANKLPNLAGHDGDLPFSRVTGPVQASRLEGNIPDANIPNIGAGKLPNLQGINGDLPFSRITGDLAIGRTSGKLGAGRINWNKNSVPKFAISGIDWGDVDNKPPLATKHYVDNAIDDLWKRALNKFQKKP